MKELTANQKEDLKNLKSLYISLEAKSKNVFNKLAMAIELEQTKKAEKLDSTLEYIENKMNRMIDMQAESLKISSIIST